MRTEKLILRNLTAVAVLLLAACASTTFTSTWKAPDVQALNPAGKTIAAVFVARNESRRRSAEDLLAADISQHGAHGVAAYTLLPDDQRGDGEAARAKLKAAGIDGVVVMRVVGRDQRITYTPGYVMPAYYGAFGPYWGYGWGAVYQPGYLQSDTVVSVETLVYSLTRDKLLWASTSRTTDPRGLDNLVTEVANATAKEMIRQGLLAP
jgi:hypothetical protein